MRTWLPRAWTCTLLLCILPIIASSATGDGWDPWRQVRPGAGQEKRFQQDAGASGPVPAVADVLPITFGRVFADGSTTLQAARLAGRAAPPLLQPVAIMADFADSCFFGRAHLFPDGVPTSTQSAFYYTAHDSIFYDHLLTDVADYFDQISGQRFELDFDLVAAVPLLEQPMRYYGNHPEEGEQPVILARDVIAAHDDSIDFSRYDTVFLIHPGAGEETDVLNDSPEQIYSTYLGPEDFQQAFEDSTLDTPYIPSNDFPEGEGIRHVLILPENEFQDAFEGFSGYYGSLGVYCFEVGLRLGMLSLTDFTPSGSPDSQGIGQFGLMGYGLFSAGGFVPPQPCAFNKQLMGWLDPFEVDPGLDDTWTLSPSEYPAEPEAAARVDLTGAEYFLLEYRLQDPDGNIIFSFSGDLNGNNVPDFYDADSANGDGTPTGYFDPETDTREWLTDSEWDFFLSDNSARDQGVKGAGSGVYIWHIDEGVVRDAFGQQRNLFNADPQRKSVDLEEADGIQDLDSRQPTPWWLGGDDDSYRAEDNATFSPTSRPDTRTNGGVSSGLTIDEISAVVVDSFYTFAPGTPDEYQGIRYASTMTFRCRHDAGAGAEVSERARLDLPGVDLAGAHLLAVPSGDAISAEPVLVAAADAGRIYGLMFDLEEWVDHDGNPATVAPLAVAVDGDGNPTEWLQPAAAGQFDDSDSAPEMVLAGTDGLYAFRLDGTPLATGPGAAVGRVAAYTMLTSPVLLPAVLPDVFGVEVVACVGTVDPDLDGAPTVLRFLDAEGLEVIEGVSLGGHATNAPTYEDGVLYVPVVTPDGMGRLEAVSWTPGEASGRLWSRDLDLVPGPLPCAVTEASVLVSDAQGRVQSVTLDGEPHVTPLWPSDIEVLGPIGRGGACLGDEVFGRIADSGTWQAGWPQRPQPEIRNSACQPLELRPGTGSDRDSYLFATRDGRLYLTEEDGRIVNGWPVAGPADLTATPVLYGRDYEGESDLQLVVVAATTPAVTGVDTEDEFLETEAVARLRTWLLPISGDAVSPEGAMYGGSPGRGRGIGSLASVPATGAADLATHHVCYPQPLTTAQLRVRGWIERDGEARAAILNLQGELVRDTGTKPVAGGQPFELEIDMAGVASGLYVCMLQAGGETSVKTIAVAQ